MPEDTPDRTCFMAMPISTKTADVERYGGDEQHWTHVMHNLFEKAIREAGFQPIRPTTHGAHLIHGEIIKKLSTADLVLVDLSSHNPNVFFELGVRTSLNLPIALVRDEHTQIPFDTSGINTFEYSSALNVWEIESQQQDLAKHVEDSFASCSGKNPLWRQFGLTIKAAEQPDTDESPLQAKVDLIADGLLTMQQQFAEERREREIQSRNTERRRAMQEAASRRLVEDVQRGFDTPDREAAVRPATVNFELFRTRVARLSEERGIPLHVGRVGNRRVVVEAPEDPLDGEFVAMVSALAERYELEVEFRWPGSDSHGSAATRARRLRPWPKDEPDG